MFQPRPSTRATPPSAEGLASHARGAEASPTRSTGAPAPTSRDLTTGLPNRWTLQKTLAEWAWKTHRNGEPLILAVVQLAGGSDASKPESPERRNRSLRWLGQRIGELAGAGDLLGRWETDRLLLISRPRHLGGGRELVRKIRRIARDVDPPVTIGITSNEDVHDPSGLIRRAESAVLA